MGELEEVRLARLGVKAMRSQIRDLDIKLARAEEALERAVSTDNAQPKEAQRDHEDHPDAYCAAA